MVKLDIKDRKALYHLSQGSRLSDRQLGRKIGLSKNAAGYRIGRLKEEGVIKNFSCVINLGAVGLDTFCLMLRFNEDIYGKEDVLSCFREHRLSNWAMTLSGDWDVFAEFVYTDLFSAKAIIEDIMARFGSRLLEHRVFFSYEVLKVEHLVSDVYKGLDLEEPVQKKRVKEKIIIDAQDKALLALLAKDSSLSYVAMAQKLGVSMDAVRYRMKRLTASGAIIKCFPEISLQKLGYTEYLFRLKLKSLSDENAKGMKSFIRSHPNTTYAFFDVFSLTLVFVCAFQTSEDVDRLARSIRKAYQDILQEESYLLVREQLAFNPFPEGLLEENS